MELQIILWHYHKNPKNLDTPKIAVIILKLKQIRFTTDALKMQTE